MCFFFGFQNQFIIGRIIFDDDGGFKRVRFEADLTALVGVLKRILLLLGPLLPSPERVGDSELLKSIPLSPSLLLLSI